MYCISPLSSYFLCILLHLFLVSINEEPWVIREFLYASSVASAVYLIRITVFINSQICHQIYQNSVIPSKMEATIQVNDNLLWAWKIFSPVSMSCMKCSELPKKPQIYRSLENITFIFVYWLSLLIAAVTWESQNFLNFFDPWCTLVICNLNI